MRPLSFEVLHDTVGKTFMLSLHRPHDHVRAVELTDNPMLKSGQRHAAEGRGNEGGDRA